MVRHGLPVRVPGRRRRGLLGRGRAGGDGRRGRDAVVRGTDGMIVIRTLPPTPPRYLTGLDLGQSADFTALVVAEQATATDDRGQLVPTYAVRHLERFALGTSYPAIVASVKALFAAKPLAGSTLVIDRT